MKFSIFFKRNRWIGEFMLFHPRLTTTRTAHAQWPLLSIFRLHSSVRARVEPPSVVANTSMPFLAEEACWPTLLPKRGTGSGRTGGTLGSSTFIAWRPPRVFLSPSGSPNCFFRHSRLLFSFPFQTQHRLFFSSSLFARLLSAAATMNLYRSFQNL